MRILGGKSIGVNIFGCVEGFVFVVFVCVCVFDCCGIFMCYLYGVLKFEF